MLGELFERTGLDASRLTDVNRSLEGAVSGIAYDSRAVEGGEVFVAIKGARHDGTAFVDQALVRGAIAVVAEVARPPACKAPWATVPDARATLATLAAAFPP